MFWRRLPTSDHQKKMSVCHDQTLVVLCLCDAGNVGSVACQARAPVRRRCTLTWYEAFPTTKKEGTDFHGDRWAGYFAAINGQRDWWWVQQRNHYKAWANRWVRIHWRDKIIDCKVIDKCDDDDTKNKECTANTRWPPDKPTGFLVDLEVNTARRIGFVPTGRDVAIVELISPKQVKYLHGAYPPGHPDRWGQTW